MTKIVDVPAWVPPTPTEYDLDWADLTVINLRAFDKPGGKEKLAQDLKNAVQKDGFWAVTGHGIPQKEIDRQFALGKHFFTEPLEEKIKVECDFENGNYFGYKRAGVKKVFGTDITDNVETFNMPKFTKDDYFKPYFRHRFVQAYREELEAFSKKGYEVARKLLVLFALILELDENYFVERHLYDDPSDDHLRYMEYHPRTEEEDSKVENTWARGHTDFGSLTLLWNQIVCGLQIKVSDGSWKYVKPVDGGIICNVGDTLSFWSSGYFKSTIHRVVRPPPDQVGAPRIGLFYFLRPGEAEITIAPSPLLKRLGLYQDLKPVKGTEYVRSRVKNYHNSDSYDKKAGEKFRVGEFEIDDGFE